MSHQFAYTTHGQSFDHTRSQQQVSQYDNQHQSAHMFSSTHGLATKSRLTNEASVHAQLPNS